MAEQNAVATQQQNTQLSVTVQIKNMISQDAVKKKFDEVLGQKAPQFLASITNVVAGSAQLKKCPANSIMSSAFVAATYDLPIDSNLGFAAIVPYNNSKYNPQTRQWEKHPEAQFQMMYKGFIQLAIRSGYYEKMNCSVVYKDELVSYNPINPEGRSILRNAYRSWYFKRRIQEIEGIGIERDLAGLPVMHGPEGLDLWNDDIDDNKQTRIALENMVKSIRRDEMEGVVLPAGYELELLSSGGTRQFDTNAIINRYDTRIAMTVLADFIFLGHSETGSWALSSDKTELFAMAIGAFLDMICETFNSQGIPPLIDINGEHFAGITEYPKMSHGDIADVDVTKVAAFIKDMTGIGILVPDDGLEDYIRQVGHLPERTTDDRTVDQRRKQQAEQNQPPEPETAAGSDGNDEGEEIPDNVAEAAKRRLGRSGANGNKVHTTKANTQGKDTGQSRSPTQT